MFIAMNRFRVAKGNEAEFETIWRSRESYLHELPGFIEFSLLKGPERDDHTLYASHTVWAGKAEFTAWTQSEQFRKAHARAGQGRPVSIGHPEFEGFEVILLDDNRNPRAAAE
ncbi:antibiotic biosynthesis monooxygenase [Rhabdaerophilum sp. SD176]|uniref:antibiotic biosynthesis monooxygenase family protein n=1 Tax=Rhabdaerophilum sp. SD176 TaxID=2983548 RepID=UPI0024DFC43E|nr:antibiotic biosynthesis monooxygenase [Rhabdaerophilum sp. SD176]